MTPPSKDQPWYTEIRTVETPEKISLDLAQHIQQRSGAGTVVVITDRPLVMLPVIRKRWVKVLREVERQLRSTLNRTKKTSLEAELHRLKHLTFAANTAYVNALADVIFTSLSHVYDAQMYATLYITQPFTDKELRIHTKQLARNGVVVCYIVSPKTKASDS